MIGLLAALAISATPPTPSGAELDARIAASARAAQALQGPLDGAWALKGPAGRALFVVQITDPAGGGPLAAAWRATDPGGRTGLADSIVLAGDRLTIRLAQNGEASAIVVRVTRRDRRTWTGWLTAGGRRRAATLARGP